MNPLNVAPLGFIQRAVNLSLQKLGVAEYCLEWRAKLVAQERQEFGFHPVCNFRFLARLSLADQQLVLHTICHSELGCA